VKINGNRVDHPAGTAAVAMGRWKQWNICAGSA
jgi:hypothetical protein